MYYISSISSLPASSKNTTLKDKNSPYRSGIEAVTAPRKVPAPGLSVSLGFCSDKERSPRNQIKELKHFKEEEELSQLQNECTRK